MHGWNKDNELKAFARLRENKSQVTLLSLSHKLITTSQERDRKCVQEENEIQRA